MTANTVQVRGRCSNGDVEIIHYHERYHEQSMEVLRKSFFLYETVCVGAEVNLDPQAQLDLEKLCLDVGRSGISLIARHVPSDRIVGVSFNLLQTPSAPGELSYFETFRDEHCVSESSKNIMTYNMTMDSKVDLFEKFKTNCLFEIMFLATLPELKGKGIASALVSCSVELAKLLKQGQATENLPEGFEHKRRKLVSALFTSMISQRVGSKNQFKRIIEVPHSEFVFRGKSYSDRIGPEHPTTVLAVREI